MKIVIAKTRQYKDRRDKHSSMDTIVNINVVVVKPLSIMDNNLR